MNEPKYFEDEIAARLRDLNNNDAVIIKNKEQETCYHCIDARIDDNGVEWTLRIFIKEDAPEDKYSTIKDVPDFENYLYEAGETGCNLFVEINGKIEPFI